MRVVAAVANQADFKGTMSQAVIPPIDDAREILAHWQATLEERRAGNAQEWEVRVAEKYEDWARLLLDTAHRGEAACDLFLQAIRVDDILIAGTLGRGAWIMEAASNSFTPPNLKIEGTDAADTIVIGARCLGHHGQHLVPRQAVAGGGQGQETARQAREREEARLGAREGAAVAREGVESRHSGSCLTIS
mgnify:CR=1 FL=1